MTAAAETGAVTSKYQNSENMNSDVFQTRVVQPTYTQQIWRYDDVMMRSAGKVENVELGITLTYGSSQSKDKDNNRSEKGKSASFYLSGAQD